MATALLMAISSLLMGLLPAYATWGILAPICLVLLRIVQGLSLGGELSGSLVYSIEVAPKEHRAFTGGLIFLGVNLGIILAYFVSYLITHYIQEPALSRWGWRIAFILGGMLGVINFYLRRILQESPVFSAQPQEEIQALPLLVFIKDFKKIVQGIGLVMLGAVSNTIVFYMPTYLMVYFKISFTKVLLLNTINLVILTVEQILLGWVADRYGRKRLLLLCAILYLLLSYPLFKMIATGDLAIAAFVLLIFALLNGLAGSCYPAMLVELFPTSIRYSGFAITYNLAFAVFAGLTPVILSYLIELTGTVTMPGIYLSVIGLCALGAIATVKDRYCLHL